MASFDPSGAVGAVYGRGRAGQVGDKRGVTPTGEAGYSDNRKSDQPGIGGQSQNARFARNVATNVVMIVDPDEPIVTRAEVINQIRSDHVCVTQAVEVSAIGLYNAAAEPARANGRRAKITWVRHLARIIE